MISLNADRSAFMSLQVQEKEDNDAHQGAGERHEGRQSQPAKRRPTLHLPEDDGRASGLQEFDAVFRRRDAGGLRPEDNFASCEVDRGPVGELETSNSSGALKESLPAVATAAVTISPRDVEPRPTKTALELAIEKCVALASCSDRLLKEKWGKRAGPILAQSLNLLAAYKAASDDERKHALKLLQAKSGVRRAPNADNLPVIAVYLCVSGAEKTRSKEQRKEWCRFATVVKVAVAASIKSDEAVKWLESRTLQSILAEWRELKTAGNASVRKPAMPKVLKPYRHLAAALTDGSEFQALAREELAKADAAVARAMAISAEPKQSAVSSSSSGSE